MINILYLDMDGVLADFEKQYLEYNGITIEEAREHRPRKEFYKYWENFISGNQFALLPKYKGCDKLLDFVRTLDLRIEILSSSGGPGKHMDVWSQKNKWLEKYGINYKANIVPGARYKKNYASPEALLIDDTEKNITHFLQAGGHAIMHTSAEDTISKLERMIHEGKISKLLTVCE
jgi:hypothetical protein